MADYIREHIQSIRHPKPTGAAEHAETAWEHAGKAAGEAKEAVGMIGYEAWLKLTESTESGKEKASSGAEYVREKMGEGADYVKETVEEDVEGLKHGAEDVKKGAQGMGQKAAKVVQQTKADVERKQAENANMIRDNLHTAWVRMGDAWTDAKDKAMHQLEWSRGYLEGGGGKDLGMENIYQKAKDNKAWGVGYFQGQLDRVTAGAQESMHGLWEWMGDWTMSAERRAEEQMEHARNERARVHRAISDAVGATKDTAEARRKEAEKIVREALQEADKNARRNLKNAKAETARAEEYLRRERAKVVDTVEGAGKEEARKSKMAREKAMADMEKGVHDAEMHAQAAYDRARKNRQEVEESLKQGGNAAWRKIERIMDDSTTRAQQSYHSARKVLKEMTGRVGEDACEAHNVLENAWGWITSGGGCWGGDGKETEIHSQMAGSEDESAVARRWRQAKAYLAMDADSHSNRRRPHTPEGGRLGWWGWGKPSSPSMHGCHGHGKYIDGVADTLLGEPQTEATVSASYALLMVLALVLLSWRSLKMQRKGDVRETERMERKQGGRASEKQSFLPDDEGDMHPTEETLSLKTAAAQGDVRWNGILLLATIPLVILEFAGVSRWVVGVLAGVQVMSLWLRFRGRMTHAPDTMDTSRTLLRASVATASVTYIVHGLLQRMCGV